MRYVMFALMFLGLAVSPSFAQSAGSAVVVLDTDRIVQASQAGQSMGQQLQAIQQQMIQEIQSEDQAIQQESRRLSEAAQGQSREQLLSNTQLTGQIAANDRRAAALRQRVQSNERDFGYTRMMAFQEFNRLLSPVINEVMQSRGAQIVVDASAVVQSAPTVDITQEVLTRLDQRSPSIRVSRQAAPAE